MVNGNALVGLDGVPLVFINSCVPNDYKTLEFVKKYPYSKQALRFELLTKLTQRDNEEQLIDGECPGSEFSE